jgi:hypothetical protein
MDIEDNFRVPPRDSMVTRFQEMKEGKHALLSPLHHQFESTENFSTFAQKAVTTPNNARAVMMYVVTRENVQYFPEAYSLWQFHHCLMHKLSFKKESLRVKVLENYAEVLADSFNNTTNNEMRETCYDIINQIAACDELDNKKVFLDKKKSEASKSKIIINDAIEPNPRLHWPSIFFDPWVSLVNSQNLKYN